MKRLFFSLIAILLLQSSFSLTEPVLRIGLVADPQYANRPAAGSRQYRESCRKIEDAPGTFNDQGDYICKNGIHSITIHGMVKAGANSYGIPEIFKDHMT